jgi:S1-C subfamily serine protease
MLDAMVRRLLVFLCPLVCSCGPRGEASTRPDDVASDASSADPGAQETSLAALVEAQESTTPPSRPPHTIFRSELARATDRGPAYFLRQFAPEPFRHHGVFVGWELTALFPDDPHLCGVDCDVALGDVILSVNGSRLETPQQLSDVFSDLASLQSLEVHSLREGKRRDVTYRIVDDG